MQRGVASLLFVLILAVSLPATGTNIASPPDNVGTGSEHNIQAVSGPPEPEPDPEPTTHSSIVSVGVAYEGEEIPWQYNRLGVLTGDTLRLSANASSPHKILNTSWNVTGPGELSDTNENDSAATVKFSEAGTASIEVTAYLRDTERNRTTKRSSIEYTIIASPRDPSFDRFDVSFTESPSRWERAAVLAHATTHLERLYANFSQRLPLPKEVTLEYTTGARITDRCGSAYACVVSDGSGSTMYMPYDSGDFSWRGIDSVYRHELTHVSQFQEIGMNPGSDWQFIVEGHAEYEDSHQFHTRELSEKPAKESLFTFNGKYDSSSLFVNAFIARYGYGTFEEFIRGSPYKSVEDAFDDYTNESFDTFYEIWAPTNTSKGPNAIRWDTRSNPVDRLGWKPRFIYRDDTLQTLGEPAKYDYGSDVNVTWDVDEDGSPEYNGSSIEWNPDQAGEYTIKVTYAHGNASLSRTQSVSVSSVPLNPTDPDDDGLYEDVNGDGDVSVTEVQALFANQDDPYIKDHPEQFDFNGDGEFSILDIQALFMNVVS